MRVTPIMLVQNVTKITKFRGKSNQRFRIHGLWLFAINTNLQSNKYKVKTHDKLTAQFTDSVPWEQKQHAVEGLLPNINFTMFRMLVASKKNCEDFHKVLTVVNIMQRQSAWK